MIDKLIEVSHQFLKVKNSEYRRYFIKTTKFSHRMSIILGQRGVGKTTTLVQLLLDKVQGNRFDSKILYIQADHFMMSKLSLYEVAERFNQMGGKWLAIDEIHKYSNWSKELKSIYDTLDQLTIFVSGSSALEIYKGTHDLIRRSIKYKMCGLSFREYLEMTYNIDFPSFSLEEICKNHQIISDSILKKLEKISKKILPEFKNYLKYGYYPYYFEIKDNDTYEITLEQNFHQTIESDLTAIYPHISGASGKKIKQLLSFVADSVPFTPNWKKLLSILEIGDQRTLKSYFSHLEDAGLARSISKASQKLSKLESPEKIYLSDTNQLYAISTKEPEIGNVRETFFLTMLAQFNTVTLPENGDFLINNQLLFEIGGKNKSFSQVKDFQNSYLALDDMEIGVNNKIPLWLFGFIY